MRSPLVLAALVIGVARCVPADDALPLGSVAFTLGASSRTAEGVRGELVADGYSIVFDRVVLGFKTMTLGRIGATEHCAFRGRGAMTDVVVDPRVGVTQTFNGIHPVDCPDVGLILGPPGPATVLGGGIASSDLFELATGTPAHAIVEATATSPVAPGRTPRVYRIRLRFDSEITSSRFGGCREAMRGIRIVANQRDEVDVLFAAENLFRDAIASISHFRVQPFVDADRNGDDDGTVTMEELDALPLRSVSYSEFYQLPDRGRNGSFGDYVRELFRFTLLFRSEDGICIGNVPGTEE